MKKKLQIFVSSTYTDLIDERQAAVQAILDSGNIPAGMELFKAGNQSQLKTIYKWIDESDVYMLILGGRYGSIESNSGKGYTELEYQYALDLGIPVFAVVLNQEFLEAKIKKSGLDKIIEQISPAKYQTFKSLVMSKTIREVEDSKDIKIAIHATLREFSDEYDLLGWIKGNNDLDSLQLIKDNNSLIKENNSLQKQIQNLQDQLNKTNNNKFGRFTFDELVDNLKDKKITIPGKYINNTNDTDTNALELFVKLFNSFCVGISNNYDMSDSDSFLYFSICPYFIGFGLMEKTKLSGTQAQRCQTTKMGQDFYAMIIAKKIL